jgi:hypothetical protein
MPLHDDAERIIRRNLELLQRGERVKPVTIGELTDKQLDELNKARNSRNLPTVNKTVLFVGTHPYNSRVRGDGYSIDDVVEQIKSAMSEQSVIVSHPKMTALVNKGGRKDRDGKLIKDRAVLECTNRNPRIEMLSIIPEGDGRAPHQKQKDKSRVSAALSSNV